MKKKRALIVMVVLIVSSLTVQAGIFDFFKGGNKKNDGLSGNLVIDGSSTVYPIAEAVAEEFRKEHPDVRLSIGVSGSGGGFKKFTVGTTDMSNASRSIKDSEAKKAKENGIEFTEVIVAYDGLSVVGNADNDFVDHLTVEELNRIWKSGSNVTYWSDVRPEWPREEIKLYGPGPDSGTFDYFTKAINGEGGNIRSDYTPSEDDNILVQGIKGSKYALGFFGYAYYYENQDTLKIIPVDNGVGPVTPNAETIASNEYKPLARPIFTYVKHKSIDEKEEVAAFVKFWLENAGEIVPETGYVALPERLYKKQIEELGLK
ncbi:MAG: PstS family phosphate ABC transporter substrate-binding protein [Fusobacteriota bacterium]